MKKLLTIALSLAMGATCVAGLAACGGSKDDAATAQKAIDTLTGVYSSQAVDHYSDYSVYAEVKVDDTKYAVNWSISSEYEGYENYVSLGEVEEADPLNIQWVKVTQTSEVVEYTLNASVTVGKKTASTSFKRRTPALTKIYTAKEANELGKSLESGSYYSEDGIAKKITVRGHVVEPGYYDTSYKNYNKIYIADEMAADAEDYFYVYRVARDDKYLTDDGKLLEKGSIATFTGFLQNYNGTIELTYKGSGEDSNVKCINVEAYTLTDKDKVALAKKEVDIPVKMYTETGDHDLAATSNGASLTWSVKSGSEYVKIEGTKMTILNVPAEPADVVISVEIKCGSETATKEIKIQVGQLNVTNDGTLEHPYTVFEAKQMTALIESGGYSENRVYVQAYVIDIPSESWSDSFKNWTQFYIADNASTTKDSDDAFLVYRIGLDDTYLTKQSDLAVGDLVTLYGWLNNRESGAQLSYQDKVNVSCAGIVKGNMSDQDKVDAVIAKIELPEQLLADYPLPGSSMSDVKLTYESNNTAALEIKDGKMVVHRTNADATVKVKATAECNGAKSEKEFTIVVKANIDTSNATTASTTIEAYADKAGWENSKKNPTIQLDDNITITATGGDNTGKYYENGENWRIYQNESPTITFTAVKGVTILTVKLTYTVGKSNNESTGGILASANGAVQYASEEEIEVQAGTVTFTVGNTLSKTNGNIQITAIEVKYAGTSTETDDDRIAIAKAAIDLENKTFKTTAEVPLTTTHQNGSTYAWVVEGGNTEYVEIESNTLKILKNPEQGEVKATLIVTISCGTGTPDTKKIEITIVPDPSAGLQLEGEGTLEKPFTVEDALAILDTLESGENYQENGADKKVHVKGFVTEIGTSGNYYQKVKIASTAGGEDTALIWSVNKGTGLTAYTLKVGDYIVVEAYLKNYNGTKEIAGGSGSDYAFIVKWEAGNAGNEVAAAATALDTWFGALPEAGLTEDQTISMVTDRPGLKYENWASNNEAVLKVEGGKLVVVARPDTDTTVEISVKISCGESYQEKTFNVKVKAKAAAGEKEETKLYTLTQKAGSTTQTKYDETHTLTLDDNTVWLVNGNANMNPWRFGGKGATGVPLVANRTLTCKTALPAQVTKMVVSLGNTTSILTGVTLKVYTSDPTAENATAYDEASTTTYDGDITFTAGEGKDWTNCYYQLIFSMEISATSNTFVTISKLELYGYAATSGGGDEPVEPTAPTVSLNASESTVAEGTEVTLTASIEYATGDSKKAEGGEIYNVYVSKGSSYENADSSLYEWIEGNAKFKPLVAGTYKIELVVTSTLGGTKTVEVIITVTAVDLAPELAEGVTLTNGWLRVATNEDKEVAYTAGGYVGGYNVTASAGTLADGKLTVNSAEANTTIYTITFTHKTVADKTYTLTVPVSFVTSLEDSPVLGNDPFGGTYGTAIPSMGLLLYFDVTNGSNQLTYNDITFSVVTHDVTVDAGSLEGVEISYLYGGYNEGDTDPDKNYPFLLIKDFNEGDTVRNTAHGTVTVKLTAKIGEAEAAAIKVFNVMAMATNEGDALYNYINAVTTEDMGDMYKVGMAWDIRQNGVISKDGIIAHRVANKWDVKRDITVVDAHHYDNFQFDFTFSLIKRLNYQGNNKASFAIRYRTNTTPNDMWSGWVDGNGWQTGFYVENEGTEFSAGFWGDKKSEAGGTKPSADLAKTYHARLLHTVVDDTTVEFKWQWSEDGQSYTDWYTYTAEKTTDSGKMGTQVASIAILHECGLVCIGGGTLTEISAPSVGA